MLKADGLDTDEAASVTGWAASGGYGVPDTAPEQDFDDIVLIASALCRTPVALVSLVAGSRNWFKARVGFEFSETSLDESICALGSGRSELLVIPDLTQDPRTAANPLVIAANGIRFYAGAPLATGRGEALGMLCVIDRAPRPQGLTDDQGKALAALARQVVGLLEMRRQARLQDVTILQQQAAGVEAMARNDELQEAGVQVRAAQAAGRIGTFEIDVASGAMTVSPEFRRLYGFADDQVVDAAATEALIVDQDRQAASNAQTRSDGSAPPDVEYQVRRADDGQVRWLNRRASFERDAAGATVKMVGTVHDITERRYAGERIDALLELGDRLRDASTIPEITQAAAEVLGRTLKVARAGYADLDRSSQQVVVAHDWTQGGASSLVGRFSIGDFASTFDRLQNGQTVAVADILAAEWLAADQTAYSTLGVRAQIQAPLLVRGELTGLIFVNEMSPRTWTKAEVEFVHGVADRTYAALAKARAEAEQQVLNRELSHRLKNTLAMVQAIASQTLKTVSEREPVEAFDRRLMALSTAHDLLLQTSWTSADLADVVNRVLQTLGQGARCDIQGSEVALSPRTTLSASLLVHELATNAMKYGALSGEAGRVAVSWRLEPSAAGPELVVDWCERGGPPVIAPQARGFGSRLIRMGLTGTGGVDLSYRIEGFSARFTAMLAQAQQS